MGDPETLGIVAFEKNPLYDKHRFISSYPVSIKKKTRFYLKKYTNFKIFNNLYERERKNSIARIFFERYSATSLKTVHIR